MGKTKLTANLKCPVMLMAMHVRTLTYFQDEGEVGSRKVRKVVRRSHPGHQEEEATLPIRHLERFPSPGPLFKLDLLRDIVANTLFYALQALSSFLFLYFACLAPIVAFGGLLGEATENRIATIESLISGKICSLKFPSINHSATYYLLKASSAGCSSVCSPGNLSSSSARPGPSTSSRRSSTRSAPTRTGTTSP